MIKTKICGITRVEDGLYAAACGTDAIGLVFYPPSSRHIADYGLAREIAQAVGPFVTVVALTVDMPAASVDALLSEIPVNLLQFHGSETEDACSQYHVPYIKALRMKEGVSVEDAASSYHSASGILLDAYSKGKPGGTGESFDWQRVPQQLSLPIILAGGLTPDNVSEAIAVAKPYAVDVSGGVEQTAGIKSPTKVNAFIQHAKQITVSP